MTDETATELAPEPEKSEIVCPVSLKFGHVQNYRCTWRKNRAVWESRPVSGTDKWAQPFFDYLHQPKEEGGLGQPEAQAAKFTHEMGVKARAKAIEMVNAGKIKAPKKNWDTNFGPKRTVTINGTEHQIGGGLPLDELKKKYPELYGTTTTTKRSTEDDSSVIGDEVLAEQDLDKEFEETEAEEGKTHAEKAETTSAVTAPMSDEELAELPDQIQGEGDRPEVEEETFAVETVADAPQGMVSEDDLDMKDLTVDEGEDKDADEGEGEEYYLKMKAPQSVALLKHPAVRFNDKDGNERTFYRIIHPTSDREILVEEGTNEIDGEVIELEIIRS